MILKFTKSLNDTGEYSLISFDKYNKIDNINVDNFEDGNNSLYETNENYYFYISKIIDIDNCEKFKIIAKKGDIVSITAADNSYIVFPSKKTFAIAFNLKYNEVLNYKYETVLLGDKPYEVKYVESKDDKVCDGVVFTLAQLCKYVSLLIRGKNYQKTLSAYSKDDDKIKRVITKYYDSQKEIKVNKKYELNMKKIWLDENNEWHKINVINITKSNKYLYDYYLIRMFAYMILTKSKNDIETKNDPLYCFDNTFNNIDEVYDFLEDNQDIVNFFFIETDILFNKPNNMYTSYSPYINGIYMYYSYNNVKTYIYRNIDKTKFDEKSLKQTYVSKNYKHKIKGIKNNYTF